MKQSVTVSAPGKLMLFGEHAVLFDKPCIVIAVEPRMQATVEFLKEPLFQLNAPDVLVDKYEKPISKIGKGEIPKEAKFVEIAVKNFQDFTHARRPLAKLKGIRVTTSSEFSSQLGLGSSSASVVSVLFGLSELLKLKLSKKELFDLAYKTVLDVQKTGSGFDVAAGVYGGTLYFKKGGSEIVSLDSGSIPLVVAFSGKKADTVSLIKKVKNRARKSSVQNIFKDIEQIVESARKVLLKKEWEVLGKLMNKNQELLEKLGVSNSSISVLIDAAKKAGAYGAKLSGAGGGDCIIAVYDGSVKKGKAIEAAMEKAGGKIINVKTHAKGVRIYG